MLVGIILYILWPFTFISFLIAWLYRKDGVITTSSYNSHNVFADYQKIKKVGKMTIIIALVYYIVFCAILGWETSSLSLSYIIILLSVLILDWCLIAVTYKNSDKVKLFGIRIFWISFLYKISRIVLFKEYLYTVRGNGDPKDGTFKIYHSLNRDTIYVGKKIKISDQNYIFNKNDIDIHTIMNDNHRESVEMNKL